jgi:hypothetical protein
MAKRSSAFLRLGKRTKDNTSGKKNGNRNEYIEHRFNLLYVREMERLKCKSIKFTLIGERRSVALQFAQKRDPQDDIAPDAQHGFQLFVLASQVKTGDNNNPIEDTLTYI